MAGRFVTRSRPVAVGAAVLLGAGAAAFWLAGAASAASALRAVDDAFSVVPGPGYADGNVLSNDTGGDGYPALGQSTANPRGNVLVDTSLIRSPRYGAAYLDSGGYFRYTPGTAVTGSCPVSDSFVYQIADAGNPAVFSQATVVISWGSVSPAVAVADAVSDSTDAVVTVDVSANDCAGTGVVDYGANYVVTGFTAPSKGDVVYSGNGVFKYTPDAGATGTDTFTYTVSNPSSGTGQASTATVTIALAPAAATPAPKPRPGHRSGGGSVTVVVNNPVAVNVQVGSGSGGGATAKASTSVSKTGMTAGSTSAAGSGSGASAGSNVTVSGGRGGTVVVADDPVAVNVQLAGPAAGGKLPDAGGSTSAAPVAAPAANSSSGMPDTGAGTAVAAVVGLALLCAGLGAFVLWQRKLLRAGTGSRA